MTADSPDLPIKRIAIDSGADFFGVADFGTFQADFEKVWPLPLKRLRFGISVGMALNTWIVDRQHPHLTP